jgi:integrase
VSVADFVTRWLRDYAKPAVRETTYLSYAELLHNHVLPTLGAVALDELRPADLQELYALLLISGRADGNGGLSPRTVRYIHSIVREALGHAVKWRLLRTNPALDADPPRQNHKPVSAWTPKDASAFLAALRGDRLYPLYLLALTTGMRRGELLGLRWQDVDLEYGHISIRQARVRVGGKAMDSETKTGRVRLVAIGEAVCQALEAHRDRQRAEEAVHGHSPGYVFTTSRGTPYSPRNVSRHFENCVPKLGLPRIRFHDLRHTLATMMLAAGQHPKVVAEMLGHSQVRITLETYTHVLPSIQRGAAEKAEELLLQRP